MAVKDSGTRGDDEAGHGGSFEVGKSNFKEEAFWEEGWVYVLSC